MLFGPDRYLYIFVGDGGKREDPLWEDIGESMEPLISRARALLSSQE